jgi:hypothetical protein
MRRLPHKTGKLFDFGGNMKRIFAVALVMVLALSIDACSGKDKPSGGNNTTSVNNSTQGGNNGGGANIGDIDVSNWAKVIKENWGIELSLPDGWTVKSAESPNGKTNIKVFFNIGGTTTYADFGATIFDATKAVAKMDIDKQGVICNSFADVVNNSGIASWVYYQSGKSGSSMVNYYDNGTTAELGLN